MENKDANSPEKTWDCLEKLIKKVMIKPNFEIKGEWMQLYTIVFNLSPCSQEKLYALYCKVVEDYLATVVMPGMQGKEEELLLRELVKQWKSVKERLGLLFHCFEYLDRSYACGKMNCPRLEDVITSTFRDLVYKELNGKVRDAVIALIDKEREGEQIDRALLKEVLDVFVEMGKEAGTEFVDLVYYKQDFEAHMIDDTGSYYSNKASSWLVEDSISYLEKAEECLEKEKERASHYMKSSEDLIKRVQHELLVVNGSQLLENQQSGFRAWIREEKSDHLSRMFKLYNEIPGGLEPAANLFKQHITDQGNALVEEAARNEIANDEAVLQNCFEKIIELNDKYLAYVKACFEENELFLRALKEAFEVFCNKPIAGAPSAELLALFAYNLIKKSTGDGKVEETLEKLANLLAYLNDRDVFVEFYRKTLAKRLLFDKSTSNEVDDDKFFVTKLKEHYGGPLTSKMEGMLTDVVLSRETHKNFEDWIDNNPSEKPSFDLSVSVLTTGFWPSYNTSDLNLPSEMVKGVEAFKKFYATNTNSKRKLTWVYSLGNCHINGRFEQKTVEIVVSTYQAAALLLFNDADRLSFSEIKTQLNLSHNDIVRVLHSLSCAKYKILNKEPNTKSISNTDSFEFNSKFSDKMRRIRITLPPPPLVEERKKVAQTVNEDRRHQIDAALVRIMKSRKVLGHQQLVSECVQALSKAFKPDIKAIKMRIEDLITREFIERDSKNPNVFNYLA